MSAGRLYYVMGPSGAGKDGVLGWVRENGLRTAWYARTATAPWWSMSAAKAISA